MIRENVSDLRSQSQMNRSISYVWLTNFVHIIWAPRRRHRQPARRHRDHGVAHYVLFPASSLIRQRIESEETEGVLQSTKQAAHHIFWALA